MADLIQEQFTAATLPSGWTADVTGDGAITFPSGTASLVVTATGTARLRSPVVNMSADGDTIRFKVDSSSSFNALLILRQSTGSTDFCATLQGAGSNWTPSRFRDSSGAGALPSGAVNFAKATPQWIQFRRQGAGTFFIESAADVSGAPGSWTVRATTDAGDSLVVSQSTTQLELLISGGAGSLVVDRVGTGVASTPAAVIRRIRMMA